MTGFDKTRLRATFGDMAISFLVNYAEELKITANTRLFLNCVGEYLSNTRNSAVLNSFFVTVMILQVVVIGVVGRVGLI